MTKMSWAGGSKTRDVSKGALKDLKYLLQFFLDLLKIHAPECTSTQLSEFLKEKIIQHATRRAHSSGSRESKPKFRVSHTDPFNDGNNKPKKISSKKTEEKPANIALNGNSSGQSYSHVNATQKPLPTFMKNVVTDVVASTLSQQLPENILATDDSTTPLYSTDNIHEGVVIGETMDTEENTITALEIVASEEIVRTTDEYDDNVSKVSLENAKGKSDSDNDENESEGLSDNSTDADGSDDDNNIELVSSIVICLFTIF